MLNQDQKNILDSAFQHGLQFHDRPAIELLEKLEQSSRDNLANFSILGLPLDFNGIKYFFKLSENILLDDEQTAWLVSCLEMNLLLKINDNDTVLWRSRDDIPAYFAAHSRIEDLKRYHQNADRFILEQLASLATGINITLPEGDARREAIIGPNNFLDQASHLPEYQEFHQSILNLAVNWFDHLFWIEEYRDAAQILNHICFALARRGQRKMAENMLATIASKTKGLTSVVAQINLATLLREEHQISLALKLYWKIIPKLLRHQAYIQLAQVLSEAAAIYRQMGYLLRSAMLLELSSMLNKRLTNDKSAAIAQSQLASTYRYLKMYSSALKNSKQAVNHFRTTNDLLNLGRSLLTQANIYHNNSKNDAAIQCFNEAIELGQRIADPQAEIGATSGKARIFLSLGRYAEAQSLLQQALSLRERYNDHNIGVEYQNMGTLHEQKGEFAMALGWYQKALVEFEKYMPVEVFGCQKNIAAVQAKYRS